MALHCGYSTWHFARVVSARQGVSPRSLSPGLQKQLEHWTEALAGFVDEDKPEAIEEAEEEDEKDDESKSK
jgi:hypothetical protein